MPFRRLGIIPTFQEFARSAAVDLHSLTDVEFELFYFRYGEEINRIVREVRSHPTLPMSLGALNHFLAEEVIASHLGDEWVEKHILDPDRNNLTRSYISMEMPKLIKALSLHRVQEMARRLHQLQSFPWFASVCSGVRTRELSGAAFELDVLWILKVASLYVQTPMEIGVKGKDYDAFALMDDKVVPVEAKAKDDRTPWSARTVTNTIRGAAKQLPKGDTGVLFFRIPFTWVGPQLEQEYEEAHRRNPANQSYRSRRYRHRQTQLKR